MAAPTVTRRRLITPAFVTVGLATLAYFTADGLLLPAVPLYVEGPLGGGDVAVGITVGAFSVTALLLRPWAGRLGDRRGRRPLMVIGGAIVGLSVAAYSLAGSVAVLTALRLVSGVGEAFFFTGAAAAVADMAPEERRGEAVSFFSLALYVGIGVGPLLGEASIQGLGFTATWLFGGALGLVAAALALTIPETRPEDAGEARSSRLIHRSALLPGTVLLASVMGMSGYFAFLPLHALEVGLSGSRFVFMLYSGIVVVIRSVGARIPDVLGPERTSRISLICSAVGLGIVALWRTPVGVLVGTSVFAVGSALAFPGLMVLALRTFTAFVDLGFGVGPALLGVVAEASGYRGAFAAASVVAVAGLALLLARTKAPERS
jgi:MFS family permease